MVLDDRQLRAIDLLAEGNLSKSDIGKMVGVSRQTIWNWCNESEFSAELDSRLTAMTTEANERMKAKTLPVVDELLRLALSDKTPTREKVNCLQYICNRIMGTPTNSSNISVEEKGSSENVNALDEFRSFIATNKVEKENNAN